MISVMYKLSSNVKSDHRDLYFLLFSPVESPTFKMILAHDGKQALGKE